MKILVISDTHGRPEMAEEVITDFENELDGFIHLGDYIDDAVRLHRLFPRLKHWAVKGNCDYCRGAEYIITEIEGHRIYMCHGHRLNVRYDVSRLVYTALENECEIAFYGHTHCPDALDEDGVKIYNPGSITLPRQSRTKTFGILNISADSAEMDIYGIFGDEYRVIL